MKKVLILISAAALVLVSCAKTQDVYTGNPESRQIAFSPLAQPNTKAPIADAALPTDYHFYVAAYAAGSGDYFDGAEFANESSNIWSGVSGSKKYWPLQSATLNFLAVTKAGSSTTTFGTSNANYASKVVVQLADNKTVQHDLMYACAQASTPSSNVPLTFQHALSWVQFTVSGTAGTGLAVTGIKLNGAAYTGTLTVNLANYNSTEALSMTRSWDATAYAAATKENNVSVPNVSSITVDGTARTVGNGLLIVPNPTENAASFASFVVDYTLDGNAYSVVVTPDTADKVMQPGYKYTYNIGITMHEIKVTATVGSWSEASGVAAGI